MLERVADKEYIDANLSKMARTFIDIPTNHWARYDITEAANGHDFTKETPEKETWTGMYE
jgi:hypothetical protein